MSNRRTEASIADLYHSVEKLTAALGVLTSQFLDLQESIRRMGEELEHIRDCVDTVPARTEDDDLQVELVSSRFRPQ